MLGASPPPRPPSPVTVSCVIKAAKVERVPYAALVGIMSAEGGKVGSVHSNSDHSVDVGPMQINSRWFPRLRGMGIPARAVKNNGCLNVAVGAWILRKALSATGNIWAAIGRYHSSTPSLATRYERRVWRHLHRIRGALAVLRRANAPVEQATLKDSAPKP